MASLKLLLGWIPSTDKIEGAEKALVTEYEKLKAFAQSDILKKFIDLKDLVLSPEFSNKKKEIESLRYKGSDEQAMEKEFAKMQKDKEIKRFFAERNDSEKSKKFVDLEGTEKLARYEKLANYLASKEFAEKKEYLLDKKRFEKTEMYKQMQDYFTLAKDPDILWYFKTKDSKKFDELKAKKMTFSDDFEGTSLNTNVWVSNYYWGDKLLHDRYTVEPDLQAYTAENVEVKNSLLKIVTKPQKVMGKSWNEKKGFSTKEFSYTSGIVNNGNYFRQKYGTFKAKVKLGNPSAKNAFWMLSDKVTPHIDVCKTEGGKVVCDFFPKAGERSKEAIPSKYANDFYIYSLEWRSDRMVWSINDVVIKEQTSNVPQEPMYILFSSGLDQPISGQTTMEVDWVTVYE